MEKLSRKLEDMFIDITFAEDREFSTAKEAMKILGQRIENTFIAIAFAEAGEFEAAAGHINKNGMKSRYCSGLTERRFTNLCTGRS